MMFINKLDTSITNKNLPLSWCNIISNRVVVNEPPIRGHIFFMAAKRKYLPEDFLGKQFGYLTILSELPMINSIRFVEAECKCGLIKPYILKSILRGLSKSCGCFRNGRMHATRKASEFRNTQYNATR